MEDDPLNETGEPVTGEDGLYVKAATGGPPFTFDGGGLTTGAVSTVNVTPIDLFEPTCTMTGPVTALAGTTTVIDAGVAASTEAGTVVLFVRAKVTTLSGAFALKPSPVIVTSLPAWPLDGSRLMTVTGRSSDIAATNVVK